MKILIDMNLSPQWVSLLATVGIEAAHWSSIGASNATDKSIMSWALNNEYVVFTHDLDFGAILASTNAGGPSVVQIRTQNTSPEAMGPTVISIYKQFEAEILSGALVIVDEFRHRVRMLPLRTD
ncbi:MAG: DUF5615 family PIN-like protein [Chthonomonadales bacterium]